MQAEVNELRKGSFPVDKQVLHAYKWGVEAGKAAAISAIEQMQKQPEAALQRWAEQSREQQSKLHPILLCMVMQIPV